MRRAFLARRAEWARLVDAVLRTEATGPPCAWAAKDVMMRNKTTALALASVLLAAPAALAAPTPSALRASLGGHPTVAAQMRAAHRENAKQDLTKRAVKLARRLDLSKKSEINRLRDQAPHAIRARIRTLKHRLAAPPPAPAPTVAPTLEAIAACESGGNPTTDTGNGFYGKYQFTLGTWAAVGGTGNPAQASEAEQDRRAAILYAQAGSSPWPVCGR
jgi:transglycosylase-like protein